MTVQMAYTNRALDFLIFRYMLLDGCISPVLMFISHLYSSLTTPFIPKQVTDIIPNPAKLSATVTFATHGEADNARVHGTIMENNKLGIFWHRPKTDAVRPNGKRVFFR